MEQFPLIIFSAIVIFILLKWIAFERSGRQAAEEKVEIWQELARNVQNQPERRPGIGIVEVVLFLLCVIVIALMN